jgi:DNA-binding response OmpR family regulator
MKKILLVDDHADIRRLVRITLGRSFQIFEAECGTQALTIVKAEKPDLVVLDVMMPGDLDGLQVLSAIRGDPELSQTRVIMVTARGQVRDNEAGMSLGADDYFVKPFSPLELATKIRSLLELAK